MTNTEKQWRTLLIDDDETTNFLNNLLISDIVNTVEIVTKESAISALDYLDDLVGNDTSKKLLIFFDINMPAMDGFEFLDTLGERDEYHQLDSAIIMLTSSINSRDIERARHYALHNIIEKPLTSEKLEEIFEGLKIIG